MVATPIALPDAPPAPGRVSRPSFPAGPLSGPAAVGRYLRRLAVRAEPPYSAAPAVQVTAGEMLFPAGAHFGPRKQAAYEIILPQHGALVIEIDGAPSAP